MEKISLVSWRRRKKKFPDTAAQRRARERMSSINVAHDDNQTEADNIPAPAWPHELPELTVDDMANSTDSDEPSCPGNFGPQTGTRQPVISVALSPEQCQAFRTLPGTLPSLNQEVYPGRFDLTTLADNHGIILQFSLYPGTAEGIPALLSVKDVCIMLKIGRRSVMRLARKGEIRYYRIGRQYRFAATDVKQYLERRSSA